MSVWASKDVEDRAEQAQEKPRHHRNDTAISPEQYHLELEISRVRGQITDVEKQLAAPYTPFRREQQLQSAKAFLAGKLQGLQQKMPK